MVMMQGVCGCHGNEPGMVRMLNETGDARANEVGRLGVRLTGSDKEPLVKSAVLPSLRCFAIYPGSYTGQMYVFLQQPPL